VTTTTKTPTTPVRPTTTPVVSPSFWQSAGLVAGREVTMRLRSKAFVFSALILLFVLVGSIIIGSLVAQNEGDTKVAAVGSAQSALADVPGLDQTSVDSEAEAEALVRDGAVEAAVLPSDDALGYRIVALDSVPGDLVQLLSTSPDVELLDPSSQDDMLVYFVALGFGLIFFTSAITFGSTISQSVVEEKQTRVVEILMSAIPARALLAGKVIGNSLLAFGQIVLTAVAVTLTLALTGQQNLVGSLGPSVLWFIGFFAVGFVLLAAMFAASAALVSRQEDVASVTTPVTMLVMIPYFLVIFFNDNDLVLTIMSYVPFSAPVGMPMRIFLGDAQWWEPILSLALIVVTTVVVVIGGARIYENSLLRTGPRVKLREALRG
jgi:ABC-2 type transport system permease protein